MLALSGELAGLPRARANERASQVLKATGLHELRGRKLKQFTAVQASAFAIAHALITEPSYVVLSGVFSRLHDTEIQYIAEICDHVFSTATRLSIISSLPPAGPLRSFVADADNVLVLERGALVDAGTPNLVLGRSARTYITVASGLDSLVDELSQLGVTPRVSAHHPGGGGRLVVHLDQLDVEDVIVASAKAGAVLREVVPSTEVRPRAARAAS